MQHKNQLIAVLVLFAALLLAGCGFKPASGAATATNTPTPTQVPQEDPEVARLNAENRRLQDRIEVLENQLDTANERLSEANDKLDQILAEMKENDNQPTVPAATPVPQGTRETEPQAETSDAPSNENDNSGVKPTECTFSTPGNIDNMPKSIIEMFSEGAWTHRVFNERLFNAQNNWGGADSWFVTLALGANSGGAWTDMGNPGQIIYRGTSTNLSWCLGVLTTSKHKDEFMVGQSGDAAINVRIAPNSPVWVTGPGGVFEGVTSDAGDITIVLPENGVVTIAVDYSTAAPTHESHVWWGPYDRSENINTIDPR